uniref:Uncharacterized protein n=1 Tax=viral metagenome TaxID=1070528 RepID=A0A6M3L8U9_9ZZZZ
MSNAIIEKIIEALEVRGFSNAEAVQMVRRIQTGKYEIAVPVDKVALEAAFKNGFECGKLHHKTEEAKRQQASYYDLMRQQSGYFAQQQFGQSYANIFGR